ncbi:MAG TPA: histidine kinase N-terminal 7TM domain-containing protein, partial [Spirochaetia bacterium]
MTFVPSWTFTVPFGAALVAAAVAVVSQMKRGMPGGRTFGFLMAAVCEWMLCLALQDAAVSGADRDIFRMLSYVGVAAAPPLLVRFAHWYSPRAWKMRAWYVVLLWIVPVLTLGIAATNSFHHLLWGGPPVVLVTAAGEIVVPVPGPWRWVVVAYTSCAAILAEVLVASSRSAGLTPSYARQRVAILVALFLPVVGTAVAQLPGVYHPAVDAMGLGFVAMGLVLLLGMRPLGIMDIVPVARDAVIEEMCDGLIVLDRRGRIVDINPSAVALLGLPASPIGV